MQPAKRFYLKAYLFWFVWVNLRTFILASILSVLSAVSIYLSKGSVSLNKESFMALQDISFFIFPIAFSFSFILMLLLVFKALFTRKLDGYTINLYDCKDEKIDKPILSDVVGLWRKWLFITIWVILVFIVISFGLSQLIFRSFINEIIFHPISLYLEVVVFGGIIFVLGIKRCKKIRIKHV